MGDEELVADSRIATSPPLRLNLVSLGSKLLPYAAMIFCVMVGAVVWNLPVAGGLTHTSMHMFAIFVRLAVLEEADINYSFISVIFALLLTTIPIGMVVAIGICCLVLTQSLFCTTHDGIGVECNRCGTLIPSNFSINATLNATNSTSYVEPKFYQCRPFEASFEAAMQGYVSDVNWLVFAAFHIGKAVEATFLGRRIALLLLKVMGHSFLGLGYAIFIAELILSPFVPSNTARGGGIMMPIVASIVDTLGASPLHHPRLLGGEFLMLCGSHANLLSASVFSTGMAANPLVSSKAAQILNIRFSYFTWLLGSLAPAAVLTLLTPPLLYYLSIITLLRPPRTRRLSSTTREQSQNSLAPLAACDHGGKSDDAMGVHSDGFQILDSFGAFNHHTSIEDRELNQESQEMMSLASGSTVVSPLDFKELQKTISQQILMLGLISRNEVVLAVVLVVCLIFWLVGGYTGVDATIVAYVTVFVLVLVNVISWKDIISNEKAWDTFFWLGGLIMMAQQMSLLGISNLIGNCVGSLVDAVKLGPVGSVLLFGAIYFYSMYIFSSLTGHIIAFVGPFLSAGSALNCPPFLLTGVLAYFSTLSGCLTNFSSGPVVIYFSTNFVSRSRWFKIGAYLSVVYIFVYFTVGLLWWKILGWW